MLILARRIGETIIAGDEVKITVLGVKGQQVRLGIDAPEHIRVHREEIYERIKKEEEKQANLIEGMKKKHKKIGMGCSYPVNLSGK